MSDLRDPSIRTRRESRARYRCVVCERFVVATEYGVCPHCGMGPPSLPESLTRAATTDEAAWRAARMSVRGLRPAASYWMLAIGFAIAVAISASVLVVC